MAKLFAFAVEGEKPFPLLMLTKLKAFPAHPMDVMNIHNSLVHPKQEKRTYTLYSLEHPANPSSVNTLGWAASSWSDFGFTLIQDSVMIVSK